MKCYQNCSQRVLPSACNDHICHIAVLFVMSTFTCCKNGFQDENKITVIFLRKKNTLRCPAFLEKFAQVLVATFDNVSQIGLHIQPQWNESTQ